MRDSPKKLGQEDYKARRKAQPQGKGREFIYDSKNQIRSTGDVEHFVREFLVFDGFGSSNVRST